MKTVEEIIRMIHLQDEVQKEVSRLSTWKDPLLQPWIQKLSEPDNWQEAWKTLQQYLSDDEKGYRMLGCMMKAAAYSYEEYQRLQIPESIYVDTMKCFTRFVHEVYQSYGSYGFDRGFWVGRQLSLRLFRIGELEFEICADKKEENISIHIPSNAILTTENCEDAFQKAEAFLETFYPAYQHYPFVCTSWLLSPALQDLLPNTSHILGFQKFFDIQEWDQESEAFRIWVFHHAQCPYEDLSEDTSLQRNMKRYLLQGNNIGEATGIVRR